MGYVPPLPCPLEYYHSSGTASDSICPKGWRLPGYSGDGSYVELLKPYSNRSGNASDLAQGDTIAQVSPLAFLRSGGYSYSGGAPTNQASYGGYWSGKPYSVTNAYYLRFASTSLSPQDNNRRGTGRSVRCLAR